jgi:DNA-binding CsgD family transcriptional regulator
VAEGLNNREIGQRLYISVKTVEAHLTRIYQKAGVSSRTQLLASLTGTRLLADVIQGELGD